MKKGIFTALLASVPLMGNNCYPESTLTTNYCADESLALLGVRRCDTENYFCTAYNPEMQAIVERLEQYIGQDLELIMVNGNEINSYSWRGGNILIYTQLVEAYSYAAKGYAYKQSHPDFDLNSYFNHILEQQSKGQPVTWDLETEGIDADLEAKVRRGMIGLKIAHEAGHCTYWHFNLVPPDERRKREIIADMFAIDALVSSYCVEMPEAALIAHKFGEVRNEAHDSDPTLPIRLYPSSISRTQNARAMLQARGIDTSAVDAAFEE